MYVGESSPLNVPRLPRLYETPEPVCETRIWERSQPLTTKVSARSWHLLCVHFRMHCFSIFGVLSTFGITSRHRSSQLSRSARKRGYRQLQPNLPKTQLCGKVEICHGASALGLSLPIRPCGPTTQGNDRAFQFLFASVCLAGWVLGVSSFCRRRWRCRCRWGRR